MKCPHCFSEVTSGHSHCSQCGFSSAAIRAYLGSDWVRLERITDNSQRLSLRDTRHLETVLDDFERRFPQCFLAAYLGALPGTLTVSDLGFWLINHGAFHTHQISRRNDFGIVLVVDPLRQSACFTVGYALEQMLPESMLGGILERLRQPLKREEFSAVIETALRRIEKALRARASAEPRTSEQPPTIVGDASDLGLQSLRLPQRVSSQVSRHV